MVADGQILFTVYICQISFLVSVVEVISEMLGRRGKNSA